MATLLFDRGLGYKNIQLFKDQVLGIGSYGKVCRAKCDDLLCAAKLIHETLFDPTAQQLIAPHREHRLPVRRFEQECQFLSTVKHPNIVQYLGIYQDPDTGLPVLLMELMDDSLTHFLEHSRQPIPYHLQVNICHDIALALSYLHSNDIIHRDLSSNNVLLIENVRAKVTDFGMARLGDQKLRATQLTFTMCPGTDVFMPPEAVQDRPHYSEKIDCFSFGVITLQILTQKFPQPGDRRKKVEVIYPELRSGRFEMIVSEIERRQNHISEVDPNHTLLQVTLDCLKDKDIERPSAQQLCERLSALKKCQEYNECVRAAQERSTLEYRRRDMMESCPLKSQHAQNLELLLREKDEIITASQYQVQQLRSENERIVRQLEETERSLGEKDEILIAALDDYCQLKGEIDQVIKEGKRLESRLHQVNVQLEEGISALAQVQEEMKLVSCRQKPQLGIFNRGRDKIMWREGRNAPCKMSSLYNAVTSGNTVYIRSVDTVYALTVSTSTWTQLPDSPTNNCPSVVINNILTLIGGLCDGTATKKLFSLTGTGNDIKWTKRFPSMPTSRYGSTALLTGTALIVAGGVKGRRRKLKVVEVMNTETLQWSTATDLPQPLLYPPGAVCGDHVYILSLASDQLVSMYTCSVSALIQSCWSRLPSSCVWRDVAAPQVRETTCVSIHGRLLTLGGLDSSNTRTAAVRMYDSATDCWEVVSHMATQRSKCYAVVLPGNKLMVVGGKTDGGSIDSVEIANVEL